MVGNFNLNSIINKNEFKFGIDFIGSIVFLFIFCSLLSQQKHNSQPVVTVIILHWSGLMMVGKMLKESNLVMNTVGDIFSLHKL